ncbi:TDP-N-acetylfucosamine:lipid II N-acetylfucosaminyltransferase [Fodinibius sp. SL11]|uniref:TDP-N-acetylfucosamine:lipid II N-acetylfucosaminyltransferase n=1 Tax=Fodinibius sp. SL11 TaxID=3425690 RepID=UPI003F881568
MNDKILHITHDEKFINGAYYLFEQAFPGKNIYMVIKPPADPPIRYLSNQLVANARFGIRSQSLVQELAKMSNHYAVIVLHGMNKFNCLVFSGSSCKDRFMGIVHGAEIYNSGLLDNELMGEKTNELYQTTIQRYTIFDYIKDVLRSFKYRNHESLHEVDLAKILYQMKVFGSLPGMNYEKHIEQKLYNPFVKTVPFSYYPIEHIIKHESLRVSGPNILLGNSASATNNHLEAFDLLREVNIADRKIVAPLSYGYPRYAEAIIEEGKKQFGDQFTPLTSFLPLEEYNQLISNCGIVIMNHYRPQAVGNIIAALYMGAKVFLNDTDIYRYFDDLGCHIYLIEKDLTDTSDTFQLLSDAEVNHNRSILSSSLGTAALVDEIHLAFKDIFDYKVKNRKREAML